MINVELLSGAWYRDQPLVLEFPETWDVSVVGGEVVPALDADQIAHHIRRPIESQRLSELASGRKRVAIIVDDLTRPTPAAAVLPPILAELAAGGVQRDVVTVVMAGGTHLATSEDLSAKLGDRLSGELETVYHDGQQDLVDLGRSERGTPIQVNRCVAQCDLKIGIGGIYPHVVAGFSGGSKIAVPGACGIETARALHKLPRATERAGSLDTEFRREIDDIAARIGLDFVVDVVVNQEREICAVFAGDRLESLEQGVRFVREHFAFNTAGPADVVIADAYPFDTTLEAAIHRTAFWPLADLAETTSRVAVAACPAGLGDHVLFPLEEESEEWVSDGGADSFLLSSGLRSEDVAGIIPVKAVHARWDSLMLQLQSQHVERGVRAVVYRCAPLLIPVASEDP